MKYWDSRFWEIARLYIQTTRVEGRYKQAINEYIEVQETNQQINEHNWTEDSAEEQLLLQESDEENDEVLLRMADQTDVHQLLQALVDRPSLQMKPREFTENEGKQIISQLRKFERIARKNAQNGENQIQAIPFYLDKSLEFYNDFPAKTMDNQELAKEVLRRQYQSEDQQQRLRPELYALTQKDTLTQFVNQLENFASSQTSTQKQRSTILFMT